MICGILPVGEAATHNLVGGSAAVDRPEHWLGQRSCANAGRRHC
jgi:hypothetical protein